MLVLQFGAFLIGLSKAGFGAGIGMIVTPLLVIALGNPREAVGVMLPLLIAGDIATVSFYWRQWDNRNVLALFPGAVVGIAIGMQLLDILPDREFMLVIGILSLVFGTLQAVRQWLVTEAVRGRYGIGFIAGVATGTASAIAHQGGLITTLYMLPQQLSNRAFVATTAIVFCLINLTKVPPYVYDGLITTATLRTGAVTVPAVVVGALLGVYLNKRVSQRLFQWIVLGSVFLTGLKLIWDYVAAM